MNKGLSRLVVPLAALMLHLWFASCSFHIDGRPYHERYIRGRDKGVGATRHRGAISLVWFFRKARPMIVGNQKPGGGSLHLAEVP